MRFIETLRQRIAERRLGEDKPRAVSFENIQGRKLDIEHRRALAEQLETVGISLTKKFPRKKPISVDYKIYHSDKEKVVDKPKIFILEIKVKDKKIAYYHLSLDWDSQTATITDKGYYSHQTQQDFGGVGIISVGFSLITEWLRAKNFNSVIGRVGSKEIENKASINSRIGAQDLATGQIFANQTHFVPRSESTSRTPGQRTTIVFAITNIKEEQTPHLRTKKQA